MTEQLRTLVGVLAAAPVVYALRRAFAEAVRGKDLAEQIRCGNVAAGLSYLGLCLLTGLLFLAVAPRAFAAPMPLGAVTHLPTLQAESRLAGRAAPLRVVEIPPPKLAPAPPDVMVELPANFRQRLLDFFSSSPATPTTSPDS